MPLLKRLFWVYFLLLIFEGALRKWVLPQFSAELLIVRDPVALLIIWEAYRTNKWPKKWSLAAGILTSAMVGLCLAQMIQLENSWIIELYGLRSYLLPFPVAFIMGENLDEEDLRKFGIATLWLLLPLTVLEVAQYLAPSSSILNAGAGAGSGQIGSSGGHARASATFSYGTGVSGYVPMAGAFILYGLVKEKFAKRWLLWAAGAAMVLSVPTSGSRTLVYMLGGLFLCMATAAFFGVHQFAKSLRVIAPLLIASLLVSLLPVFSDATGTLLRRFSEASDSAHGESQAESFGERVYNGTLAPLEEGISSDNWIGEGVGYGSNVAAMLLTGTQTFLAGEGETDRVTHEFGPIFGIPFLLFRWALVAIIAARAIARVREGEPLAWLLLVGTASLVCVGIMEQPTEQGFMVINVAFSLAALKLTGSPVESMPIADPRWLQAHNDLNA